ncbi:MAG: hypothetical protein KIT87_29990, partial [Anaerolineae bacterium]|nr:hypothetical protein [Anaerolineae bacterium]
MHDIRLGEARVRLGEPRQVTEGVDYHWFPSLAKFPTGELMLSHLLVADTNENHLNGNGVCISRDHGETWDAPYEVTGFIGGCAVRVPLPDGGLGAPGYYAYPDPTGRSTGLVGHYETFTDGGRRYSLEPWAVRIEGLPRPVAPSPYTGRWGRHWMFQFCFWGDAVDLGGEVVSLAYLRY